jgi:hypothetical protein
MAEELTTIEAERQYPNISRGHLTHLAQQGVIKARRIGPMWLLEKDSLEHWLANRPKRGGYRGRKAHRKPEAEAGQPAQVAEAPPTRPDRPVVVGERPPAQETTIDIEDTHIRIDPLLPAGERWLEAEAIAGDMRAVMYLRPYGTRASVYTLAGSYDRAETYAPGRMGRKQEQRGKALLALLEKHMRAALMTAGW